MEEQKTIIAYLSEPTNVSSTSGKLRGTLLRAIEVSVAYRKVPTTLNGPYKLEFKIGSTGNVFTMNSQHKIVKSYTNINVNTKFIRNSWNVKSIDEIVISSIGSHKAYGCVLYTSPELAIAAKIDKVVKDAKHISEKAKQIENTMQTFLPKYTAALEHIATENPEILI